jgi:hypothetical protein
VQKLSVRHVSNSLSTQRRQTIHPEPHRGRCGLTTAYALAMRSANGSKGTATFAHYRHFWAIQSD